MVAEFDPLSREGRQHCQPAVLHRLFGRKAKGAALGQLVVQAAAEQSVDRFTPQRPENLGARVVLLQFHERQSDIDCRMAAADNQRPLSGVAFALGADDIGNAVGDALPCRGFARHRQTVYAHRVRLRPGSRGIDHGTGAGPVFAAVLARHSAMTKADCSRPSERTLSRPSRVIAVTVAPSLRFAAISGSDASGCR